MKRPILVAAAAATYLMAAWMVAPGFYDGFTPPRDRLIGLVQLSEDMCPVLQFWTSSQPVENSIDRRLFALQLIDEPRGH